MTIGEISEWNFNLVHAYKNRNAKILQNLTISGGKQFCEYLFFYINEDMKLSVHHTNFSYLDYIQFMDAKERFLNAKAGYSSI